MYGTTPNLPIPPWPSEKMARRPHRDVGIPSRRQATAKHPCPWSRKGILAPSDPQTEVPLIRAEPGVALLQQHELLNATFARRLQATVVHSTRELAQI